MNMSGITELAKLFNERNNKADFAPVFGTVASLPDLKIQRNDKDNVVLAKIHIKSVFNVWETDDEGNYIYLNKQAVLLPYDDDNKYILIGVVQSG